MTRRCVGWRGAIPLLALAAVVVVTPPVGTQDAPGLAGLDGLIEQGLTSWPMPSITAGVDGARPPGLHAVGFRLLAQADPTRSFPSDNMARPRSRPMRVYVWYPARAGRGAPMTVGDFVDMAGDDVRLTAADPRERSRPPFLPVPLAKGLDQAELETLLRSPVAARRNAAAAGPRPYPVLVVGQGLYYEAPVSQMLLCEYLASRGYIVATSPLLGTQHRLVNLSVGDLETAVRDLEFVMGSARAQPGADSRLLGVIGFDLGGMGGLVLTMRNPGVGALLTFDAGILSRHWSGLPGDHPHYREDRFGVPWMHMTQAWVVEAYRKNPAERTLMDRKRQGDSLLVAVPTANHGQFSSYSRFGIRKAVPGYWGQIEGDAGVIHDEIGGLAGWFFDAFLKGDASAMASLRTAAAASPDPGQLQVEWRRGGAPQPSGSALVHLIIEKGIREARPVIDRIREESPGWNGLDEAELNWLGRHFLLWWGREAEAIEVYRLNADLHPRSSSAYEGLGDALRTAGRTAEAIEAYQKALELDPKSGNAATALEQLTGKK